MTSTRAGRSYGFVAAIGVMGLFTLQFVAQQSHAAERLWDNVNGGVFSDRNNWFGGVPGTEDVARFETTNSNFFQRTYTVDFHTDPINQQLVVEDDAVTFNLMGHTYELTNEFVAAAIGTVRHPDRSGNLTVINGALALPFRADLEIAAVPDSNGALTVGAGGAIRRLVAQGPDIKVGLNGNGTFELINGGTVLAHSVTLGDNHGSTGKVTVSGNGSRLDTSAIHLSRDGSGALHIEDGGHVSASNVHFGDRGALHLAGGTLLAQQILEPSPTNFSWTSGTFLFFQFLDDLTIPDDGVLSALLTSRVGGNLTVRSGATTQFLLGDFGSANQMQVDGHVVIESGTLQLLLDDEVLPNPEDKFEIMTTGAGIFGSFANVANGQRLAAGDGSFLVNYGPGSPFDPTSVFISSYLPATPGDFDVDGDVDGNDFLVWQRGGSPNHNDSADLVAWRVNFGTSGTAAASSVVPEPSGEWISLAAISLACAIRRGSGAALV